MFAQQSRGAAKVSKIEVRITETTERGEVSRGVIAYSRIQVYTAETIE